MNLVEKEISIYQQTILLTNQRAIYWPKNKSLILSDLHLGKTAHFRKNGIALPANIIQQDLLRLSHLISFYAPKQLIIVGDFLHAGKNSEFELFKNWRKQFPELKIILVKGNHDRLSAQHFEDLGISEIHTLYQTPEIIFSHENLNIEDHFVISGHLHPGVRLQSSIKKFLKFPCYIVSNNQLVLPAFSSFTGLDTKDYYPASQKYIFGKDFLISVDTF